MALGTTRLHPTMNQASMTSALNQNFALLENINHTLIYKDRQGNSRIILGEWPDGTWGLIISKPGTDVRSLFT